MGFRDLLTTFLGIPSSFELEQLREKVYTQEKLLENSDIGSVMTNSSSFAREQKLVEDYTGQISKRFKPVSLMNLYLTNQFIFRGVNVRAHELVTRGYKVIGNDKEGVSSCEELIDRSGGDELIYRASINCDVCGDAYYEKVPNKNGKAISLLRHVNPVTFGFLTELDTNKIILDEHKVPKAYMQRVIDTEGKEERTEVPKDRIAHLIFNSIGDEFNGISTIQPVYLTSLRLMNMEQSAAEAAVKTANPIYKIKTATKSPRELSTWMKVIGRVSGQQQVAIPDGMDIETLSPGPQNFSAYSNYFLDAVVSSLGVPKSILTGSADSGGGNRSTVLVQSKHFYSIIRLNQRAIEKLFNNIFEDYASRAGFEAPKLVFEDIAEDAEQNGQKATDLFTANLITVEEARTMIGLETPHHIKLELDETSTETTPANETGIEKEIKNSDKKTYFPPAPGSPAGSQRGVKKKQKIDPDIKSVK